MNKIFLILAVSAMGLASCGEPAPQIGEHRNGMVYVDTKFWGKDRYQWVSEDDYNRIYSPEAEQRRREELRYWEERKRAYRVSENAQRILSGRDPLPYHH